MDHLNLTSMVSDGFKLKSMRTCGYTQMSIFNMTQDILCVTVAQWATHSSRNTEYLGVMPGNIVEIKSCLNDHFHSGPLLTGPSPQEQANEPQRH